MVTINIIKISTCFFVLFEDRVSKTIGIFQVIRLTGVFHFVGEVIFGPHLRIGAGHWRKQLCNLKVRTENFNSWLLERKEGLGVESINNGQ